MGGDLYLHAPFALHVHTTASERLFGDHEWAVRLVPAVHGLLAALALFLVVRGRRSALHAVLVTALYVPLSIDRVCANMVNHSTGLILWSLVLLDRYLAWREGLADARRRASVAPVFASAFLALS